MTDGIINVLKPVGMTSHDVVDAIRRLAGTRRVGHTGTLDPGATGVLVIAIGKATRVAEFVSETDKEYRVEITFGKATDTGDAYGQAVAEHPEARVDPEKLGELLGRFVGEIEQVPPMASAVHLGGRRLYELHRQGTQVEVPPRRITISQLELIEFDIGPPARAWLHVSCSKGTYIRKLCHDIGEAQGSGAYASFMVRTRVGRYSLEDAYTLEELAQAAQGPGLSSSVESADAALADLPVVELLPPQRQAVMHGQPVPLFKVAGWQSLMQAKIVRLRDAHGLLALARVEQGVLKPFKVLRDN